MGLSEADEQAPDRVVAGRYRLLRVLGRGGMGVVWLATDTLIERRVALKELRLPADVTQGDESSFMERALREARNAGRLNHPGVVAVHDVIAPTGDDTAVYIVMEYVEAPTLADLIDQEGPLTPPRVAALGVGILDPLMAAHTMGIVHRDIKPSNVLVRDGDRVKLTDFGIALAAEDSRLTRSGVMGTHAYLAPEAFDTGQVGPAADLWALGATLFHAVAGRAPFERDTTTATLRAILLEDAPAPPCPPPLAEVITGLLTRPVERRLTGDAARDKLQQLATAPEATTAPADGPGTGGADQADQSAWDAQATTVHRSPTTPPPAQPWGQATQPGGPPSPYGTTPSPGSWGQTTQPGGPPSPYPTGQPAAPSPGQGHTGGFSPPGSGPARPQQPAPTHGGWPAGSPPRRNNNTPLLVGGIVAAAAVLLLVVIVAASGGGGGGGSNGGASGSDPASDAASDAADGQAFAQDFLDAINRGDEATALGMLCPDSSHATDITDAIVGGASVEMEETVIDSSDTFQAGVGGTVNGESITLGSISVDNEDTGWCVFFFEVA